LTTRIPATSRPGTRPGTNVKFVWRRISRFTTGVEFLSAECIIIDDQGPRRTYLYLTGARGHFVKIRVTLTTNDEFDATSRNFVDSVVTHFFDKDLKWNTSLRTESPNGKAFAPNRFAPANAPQLPR
jgi:hypothetical protein